MPVLSPVNPYTRRMFMRTALLGGAGLFLTERILSSPYEHLAGLLLNEPVLVRGRVTVSGKPAANISVSDGVSVVRTAKDGSYRLQTDRFLPYVFVSIPAYARIPTDSTYSARFYKKTAGAGRKEIRADFQLVAEKDPSEKHGFILLADPQILDEYDVQRYMTETVPDIKSVTKNIPHSLFSIGCGDLVFDKLNLFEQITAAVTACGVPGFQVVGNHDIDFEAQGDPESNRPFLEKFGPAYYSFDRGEIHYVVLDDIFWNGKTYIGYIDDTQLNWLRQDLSFVEAGKTVVLFSHIPPFTSQHIRQKSEMPSDRIVIVNREKLYRLLAPYNARVISGHMHETEHITDNGVRIHVCGAVCGAWWESGICGDGTPNGYGIYEANGSELSWKYKSTGKPFHHQLSVHKAGEHPDHPAELCANVWDHRENWKVFWYEDGIRKGLMEQRTSKDPRAIREFAGRDIPPRHKWVEPYLTSHLFFAAPSAEARKITIEVETGGGEKYTDDV